MPTTPELDAALVAAAQALPAHFSNADELTIESLDAIQATTMSLPGGAFAVESVVQGNDDIGSVVLIITGLVDHKNGEVFDRTEARTLWTAALDESFAALQAEVGEFKTGQSHMTDPFDVLETADEASVAGVFEGQTLAALLLAQPKEATGQGAAAELAAAIAAAEAEATAEEGGEDADAPEGADGVEAAEGAEGTGAGEGEEENPEFTPSADAAGMTGAPGADPAAGMPGMPGAGMPGGMPGAAPGMPGMPGMPGYDPYAGYPPGAYPPPGYPPYGYAPPPQDPEQAAAAAAAAAARAQANMNLPGMATPPLAPFAPGGYVDPRRIDLLREVLMGVSVELGRTRLTVSEILGLTPGSVVELDRAAGAPVDVLVNGTLIAHGEVVVVDEEFAVRISEVVNPQAGGEGRASA